MEGELVAASLPPLPFGLREGLVGGVTVLSNLRGEPSANPAVDPGEGWGQTVPKDMHAP
jgi:hypothetical protein